MAIFRRLRSDCGRFFWNVRKMHPEMLWKTVMLKNCGNTYRHITQRIAKEVETICGLSYKYAGTLFKEETGQTIHEYQRMLRVRRAKQLLKETDKPITDIAQLTGFSDVFYFSRVFRAQQGCPPSEYRRTYIPGI